MIVHLAGSLGVDVERNASYLRHITNIIHDEGSVLAHNWIEAAIVRKKDDIEVANWKPFVDANLDAIKRADLMIIDLTNYTFAHGFQVAAALENNKPILALSRESLNSKSASGLTNPLFSFSKFSNEADLEKSVRLFLKQNVVHTKDLRFNMFLTREIVQFLDEKSDESGVNRSEIIRKLIRNKVQKRQSDE